MVALTTALVLLLAVVVSGWIARASPIPAPLPLVQIGLGAAISAVADLGIALKPEVFFLLFLPPLLFLDAWRIPKEGLLRERATILRLAIGLVVFTVLGIGLFVHWLIPQMPLPVAFALAAVISPTDPVAVAAIAARTPIPPRLMHVLEGEALLNDASGLVCMRFAVAAALTGAFSLVDAFGVFLWLAIGGLATGVAVTLGVGLAKRKLGFHLGEDVGSQVLTSLLIPFGAYLVAEHLQASGILAAVGAGVTMSYVEQSGRAQAMTRVRREAFWDTLQFAANGVIFLLLGEQLPEIVEGAARAVSETGHDDRAWLILYILAINLSLVVLRCLWVWIALRQTMFREGPDGPPGRPGWRLTAAMSFAGVRGAVTLAGVLTLPLALPDGAPFPARDLAILLAAGVIVVSLVLANVALPPLLARLEVPPEPSHLAEEQQARIAAAQAAIQAIDRTQHELAQGRGDADLYAEAAARVMEIYRRRVERGVKVGDEADRLRQIDGIERALRLSGLRAERETYFRLGRRRRIPEQMVRELVRQIDLLEARL